MASDVILLGRVRKILEALDAEFQGNTQAELVTNQQLELLVAQGSATQEEIVRVGRAFYVNTTTAIAAVVAIPTTGHLVSIYNNQPDGGRSLIIDWVAVSGVAKTAAAGQQQIIGNIGQVREAIPTDAALSIKKRNGVGTGVDTLTRTILSGTALPAATGVAANWFPIGPAVGSPGAAGTPGHGAWQKVDGDIIVPPGRYFAIHVIADVVGSTYQGFIAWHEKQVTLG
jgi:hypothetical protein